MTKENNSQEKFCYSVDEVRNILGIGRNQAYGLAKEGKFPTKRIGRRLVISKKGFDDWLSTSERIEKYQMA